MQSHDRIEVPVSQEEIPLYVGLGPEMQKLVAVLISMQEGRKRKLPLKVEHLTQNTTFLRYCANV